MKVLTWRIFSFTYTNPFRDALHEETKKKKKYVASMFLKYILPAVIAALVSIIVCYFNNVVVLKLEEKRQNDKVRSFRYQALYDFLKASIGSPEDYLNHESAINVLSRSPKQRFLFEREQYFKIRSLLEESYRSDLDNLFLVGLDTLEKLLAVEDCSDDPGATDEEKEQYRYYYYKFRRESNDIHENLQATIQKQIIDLM